MQDKTINNALLALRKQIIRANGDGLAHVEAMLVMRGVHMPAVLPTKLPDVAGKGIVAYLIIQALRGGPKRMSEVAAYVDLKRPEFDFQAANIRTGQAKISWGSAKRGGNAPFLSVRIIFKHPRDIAVPITVVTIQQLIGRGLTALNALMQRVQKMCLVWNHTPCTTARTCR